MTENALTPALGRLAPIRFHDSVVALTRERLWRTLTAVYVAPRPGDLIGGTSSTPVRCSRAQGSTGESA